MIIVVVVAVAVFCVVVIAVVVVGVRHICSGSVTGIMHVRNEG